MAEFKRCFQAIDTENTGSITVEALRKYMQRMHYKEGFVEKWIKLFNPDEEGKITFEKYCGTLGLVARKSKPGTSLGEHPLLETPRAGTDASSPGKRVFDEAQSHEARVVEEPTEPPGAAGQLQWEENFVSIPETTQTCQPEGLLSPSRPSKTALSPPIMEGTSKVNRLNVQSTAKHKQVQRCLKMKDSPESTVAEINQLAEDAKDLFNHPRRENDQFTSSTDRGVTPITASLSNKAAHAGKNDNHDEIQAMFTPIEGHSPHYEQPTLSECPTDQSATSTKESVKRKLTSNKHKSRPSSESVSVNQDQSPTKRQYSGLISKEPEVTVNTNWLEDDSLVISSETNNIDEVGDSKNMKIVGTESKGSSCPPENKITSILSLERDFNIKEMLGSLTMVDKYSKILGSDAPTSGGQEDFSEARVTGQIPGVYRKPTEDLPQNLTQSSLSSDPAPMSSVMHATDPVHTPKRQKKKRSSTPVPAASEKRENSPPQYCHELLVKEAAEPEPLINSMSVANEQHPGRLTKALVEDIIIIPEAAVMDSSAVRDAQPASLRARTEQPAVSDKRTRQRRADEKSVNNRSPVGLVNERNTGSCEKVILVISASEDQTAVSTLSQAPDQRQPDEPEVMDRATTGKRTLAISRGAGTSQAPSHGKRLKRTQMHQAKDKSEAMAIAAVTKETKLPLQATGDSSILAASTIHSQSRSEEYETFIEATRMCSDQFSEYIRFIKVTESLHEQTVRQQKATDPQQTEITMETEHSNGIVFTERDAPHPTVSMANYSQQIVSVHPNGVQEGDIRTVQTLIVGDGKVERTCKSDACHEGYLSTLSPRQRNKLENVQKRWENRIKNYQRKKKRRQKCLEAKQKSPVLLEQDKRKRKKKSLRKCGRRKGRKDKVSTADETPPVSTGRSNKYGRFPRGYAAQIDPDMWRRLHSKDTRKRRSLLQQEVDFQWKGWRSKKGRGGERLPGQRKVAARLRPSLRGRGVVVILLAGRHRGKRVVSMGKHLASGLLLVTGPFRYNGCPLRRVHPSLVIATKTRVDLKQFRLPARVHKKDYFARPAKRRLRNMSVEFLKEESSHQHSLYQPCEQRRADQRLVDTAVMQAIESHPEQAVLIAYLKSIFSLSKYDRPHKMFF